MISKIRPDAHGAAAGRFLVFWPYESEADNVPVRRRRWLAGCALGVTAGWTAFAARGLRAAASPEAAPEPSEPTEFLPLFPLGVVAFPGEQVLLHIFEPRYKQLMTESAATGNGFGIVTVVPGGASSIGTEMRLDRIFNTDEDGNLDVATRGVRAFELKRFQQHVEGKLYSAGEVAFLRNDSTVDPEIQSALVQLFNRMRYRTGFGDAIAAPYPENLSFLIGHQVGMSQAQELQLLTMAAERDRQTYLFQHLLRAGY